jgi:hypothetical protein
LGDREGESQSEVSLGKNMSPCQKNNAKKARGVIQVVKPLPSKLKTLPEFRTPVLSKKKKGTR